MEGVISSPGAFIAAGLPNITGSFSAIHDNYGYSRTGAIETSDGIRNMNIQGGNIGTTGFTFNASWVNSIYGNSNTVQPPAYTVYYIIRIN